MANRQVKAKFYSNPKDFVEYYVVINEEGRIDAETICSKKLSQEEVDNAEFLKDNDGYIRHELVEVEGKLGLYDYNMNCVEEYNSMSEFLQALWSRDFGNSVLKDVENDSVYKSLEFECFPK